MAGAWKSRMLHRWSASPVGSTARGVAANLPHGPRATRETRSERPWTRRYDAAGRRGGDGATSTKVVGHGDAGLEPLGSHDRARPGPRHRRAHHGLRIDTTP